MSLGAAADGLERLAWPVAALGVLADGFPGGLAYVVPLYGLAALLRLLSIARLLWLTRPRVSPRDTPGCDPDEPSYVTFAVTRL